MSHQPPLTDQPLAILPEAARQWFAAVRGEMAKTVVGQSELVEQLVLTLLCREHALMEGAAGTGKWLAVEAMGRCFGLCTHRIRSSPDLNRDDLLERGAVTDPWRSSLLLVEHYNLLAPKLRNLVQQAMSERMVDGKDERKPVPDPFVVFAARHRGDEPVLPDEHDDRFMFQIDVPYPTYHEEFALAVENSSTSDNPIQKIVDAEQLLAWQSLVPRIEALPSVVHYAVRLVRATRVHEGENPDFIYEWVQQGAGPRGAHFLVLAAKARATLVGRSTASHEDVRAVCLPVLRHRIVTNQNARANGIGPDRVVRRLIEEVPPRIVGDESNPTSGESFTFHDWIAAE